MFDTVDIIIKITFTAQLGACCALFSYFLDYCMWPQSIFKAYLPWLASRLMPRKERDEVMMLSEGLRPEEFVRRGESIMLWKLLGGCVFCFNVWITFASFPWLGLDWPYIFVYTPVSHFILRKVVG